MYSPAGRLQSRLWARGITTTYGYNAAGDLETVTYDDGVTPDLVYAYDRRGRRSAVTQGGTNTTAFIYNSANQLIIENNTAGLLAGLLVTNGYDQYLRRTNLAALDSGTPFLQHDFAYDTASRLDTVTDNSSATVYSATYIYLANSPLVSQITFTQGTTTGMTTTKQYDFLNRLVSVSSAPTGGSAVGFSYAYNNANQRIRSTLADGSYWLYEYDALGQVLSGRKYWPDQTPVAGQQFEYAHDDIGNRTQTRAGGDENGSNLRSASYGANMLNQYTNRTVPGAVDVIGIALATNTVTVNNLATYRKGEYFHKELSVGNSSAPVWQTVSVTAPNETTVSGGVFVPKTPEQFTYDADGNLTNDGRWTYIWDAENRLVKLAPSTGSGPQISLRFEYDWQGRRIRKQVWPNPNWDSSPTNDVKFVYDGWNLVAILHSDFSLLNSFVWGTDLSGTMQGAGGVGGLLEVTYCGAQTTNCFVAFDGNGNVAALVDATDGTIAAEYEYGPFGEVIRATGPMAKANPFRFSTKYQDDETDLLYYGYRYFSASTGKWLSREPLGELGANLTYNLRVLDGLEEESRRNPYAAMDNTLVHRYDVLGLSSVPLNLLAAMALGNVAQVEAILAGMEEGDPGYAIAQAWLKKVAECISIHASYSALKVKGCSDCVTSGEAKARAAVISAAIAGRTAYLKLKCDYCLEGSIKRGSAKSEKGHQAQVAQLSVMLAKCLAKAATLPSNPPLMPPPATIPAPAPDPAIGN